MSKPLWFLHCLLPLSISPCTAQWCGSTMENVGSFDFCFSVSPNEWFRHNPLIVFWTSRPFLALEVSLILVMIYLFNKVSFINFHGYGLCYSTTKLVYEASDNVKPSSVNQRSSMMSLPPARCMTSTDSGKCCHCPNFNHSLNQKAVVPIHESCCTIK